MVIFIEGVSGVGKSTMVSTLSEKLQNRGYRVKSFLEFDYTNPIDFYCTAIMTHDKFNKLYSNYSNEQSALRENAILLENSVLVRYFSDDTPLFCEPLLSELWSMEFCYNPSCLVPFEKYTETYKEVWSRFCNTIDVKTDFYLFDGSLLHHPINDMMRNYNADNESVLHHIRTLISTMDAIDWQVFYLHTDTIDEQLRKAHIHRKQKAPDEEQLAFWHERYRKDMFVLENGVSHYRILDITDGGWNRAEERILSCIV